MGFSFNTPLSGLNANTNALNVVGNNIANASTIGFRSGAVTFSEVFTNNSGARLNGAGNSLQIGGGVKTGAIHTNFEAGSLNESGSPLHVAIQGNGFFVVRNSDGSSGYSRAGDFTVNHQGLLLTSSGGHVQGYMATNGTIPSGTPLSNLQLPLGQTIPPNITTTSTMVMNLAANAATGDVFNSTVQVFDSRGTSRTMTMTFTRLADGSFDMMATVGGVPAQLDANGAGPAAGPVNFTFGTNGLPTNPTSLAIIPDPTGLNGATLPSINIGLNRTNADGSVGSPNITSYYSEGGSSLSSASQDGFTTGELSGAAVDQNGVIFGIFSNGQTRTIGQYALARFNSEAGLRRLGGNMFGETISSGPPAIGEAGSGGRGGIAGGYLEQSNVNITNEFIALIEAQRGFQANSRVITTVNQTIQDLLQII